LNRAALYLEKNLYEKAYLDYCNVIDIDRKNQEALLYRAYIYMQRRDYKEARIDYNTLLQEEPKNKMGRLGMALLNQKELKFREALEEFNRMITDYPNDASLLKARANLEIEMNTPDLALLDLESAAKLSPKDAEIYVMCGEIYLSQKKKREAYVAFEKAIELGVPRPELQDKLKASK
jgi:tetratricopeptide (TPR) repeat protein